MDATRATLAAAVVAAVAAVTSAVLSQPYFQQKFIEPHFCDRTFELRVPVTGQSIEGRTGVVMTGRTCGFEPGEHHGWIFDFDPEDGTYYSVSAEPIESREWALVNGPIGNRGDNRKRYALVVFAADATCNRTLLDMIRQGDGETSFTRVPAGCREDDRRDIIVTYPR
ncbi:hypothetical protein [Actinoplanes sp. G11-F43]|uniref:hypothetical protein n=1 Tax=Actinoplanes sp. G11-F43 TaxID=3424130 RepID=UPI003D335FA9